LLPPLVVVVMIVVVIVVAVTRIVDGAFSPPPRPTGFETIPA
jgi:hypothetical protein